MKAVCDTGDSSTLGALKPIKLFTHISSCFFKFVLLMGNPFTRIQNVELLGISFTATPEQIVSLLFTL